MRYLLYMIILKFVAACISIDDEWLEPDPCPSDMVYVSNPRKKVDVCVDRFELTITRGRVKSAKPLANQSYHDCRRLCALRGKRLLWHREWVVACEGTQDRYCNKFRTHPVLRKISARKPWRFNNIDCKARRNAWGNCMKDPSLNQLPYSLAKNGDFSRCVSRYGVHHMIGNLGEWVLDVHIKHRRKLGRFNGGLYPQNKSSCQYTTIAHAPDYKDYSIGCRCGKNPQKTGKEHWKPY